MLLSSSVIIKDDIKLSNANWEYLQRILKYGTKWDILLMFIGAVMALVTGVA